MSNSPNPTLTLSIISGLSLILRFIFQLSFHHVFNIFLFSGNVKGNNEKK